MFYTCFLIIMGCHNNKKTGFVFFDCSAEAKKLLE